MLLVPLSPPVLNLNGKGFGFELFGVTGRRVPPVGDSFFGFHAIAAAKVSRRRKEAKQAVSRSADRAACLPACLPACRPVPFRPAKLRPSATSLILALSLRRRRRQLLLLAFFNIALVASGTSSDVHLAPCNNRATNTTVHPLRANLNKNAVPTSEHSSFAKARIIIYPTQWKRRG